MCTVSYFPTQKGYVLTHNRDEAPHRSSKSLTKEYLGDANVHFPRDEGAQGTWIAASACGRVACLLNGAFVKHNRTPPYRRSRGLLLLEGFEYARVEDFIFQYDCTGIEPFTCLFFEGGQLLEFRWDGLHKYFAVKDAKSPHFWSSATLYPADMQARRHSVFEAFVTDTLFEQIHMPVEEHLLELHLTGSVGDPENDFVMNREGRVRTLSITQVVCSEVVYFMRYIDLLNKKVDFFTEISTMLPG